MSDEKVCVTVGDKTLWVSEDLLEPAGYRPVERDATIDGVCCNPAAFERVISAVSIGLDDDEAFRWAASIRSERMHEQKIAELAKTTAEIQLRTAQLTLAAKREGSGR